MENERVTRSDGNIPESVVKFQRLTSNMLDTYRRKNHDYGNSFEQSLDKFGIIASVVRMGDKMNRIESLARSNNPFVKTESVKDTLMDLANYAVMTVMWLDDRTSD